jgi:hypothetical protein
MTKKQKKIIGHKNNEQKGKIEKLASHHTNLLKDGFMRDGVKCVHHIHLQHHPVEMDI